jgi:predicted methyltransferase
LVRFYHDFGRTEVDRPAFNKMVFQLLKPGAIFGVIDRHGKPGTGMCEGSRLHRVEASLVTKEVEAAGFQLEAESCVLNDPTDPRDFNIFANQAARRDRTDRFVYLFRKPD